MDEKAISMTQRSLISLCANSLLKILQWKCKFSHPVHTCTM